MLFSAIQVAKYIITKCTNDQYPISNLQLQKILYYVQKNFLQNDLLAFSDDIEAWQFGPVVPAVYRMYCGFGAMPIQMKYDEELSPDVVAIINPIIENKRVLNPWEMVKDTHQEGKAWSLTYEQGQGCNRVITKELIKHKG